MRQARHIPVVGATQRRDADFVVGALADHVQLALELRLVDGVRAAGDEHLADEGLARLGGLAEHGVVGRHRARAEVHLAFGLHGAGEGLLHLAALGRVARHEDQAAAVLARLGQLDMRLPGSVLEEEVRHLHEHAGAVASVGLAATGATMVEVLQDLDGLPEDVVGLAALDIGHETEATGVVLELRVVQTLLAGAGRARRGCGRRLKGSRGFEAAHRQILIVVRCATRSAQARRARSEQGRPNYTPSKSGLQRLSGLFTHAYESFKLHI